MPGLHFPPLDFPHINGFPNPVNATGDAGKYWARSRGQHRRSSLLYSIMIRAARRLNDEPMKAPEQKRKMFPRDVQNRGSQLLYDE